MYPFLGLTVGALELLSDDGARSYDCDVTYGTNNEFDATTSGQHEVRARVMVQRGHVVRDRGRVDSI